MIDSHVIVYGGELFVPEHSRIDSLCVITGAPNVLIENYVHIATGVRVLASSGKIIFKEGSFVGMGSTILTGTDNYCDGSLMNPTFPFHLRNVTIGDVVFEEFAGIATHCVVMPGVTLRRGAMVGACSFVKQDIPEGEIWAGCPAKKIGERNMIELEKNIKMFKEKVN